MTVHQFMMVLSFLDWGPQPVGRGRLAIGPHEEMASTHAHVFTPTCASSAPSIPPVLAPPRPKRPTGTSTVLSILPALAPPCPRASQQC